VRCRLAISTLSRYPNPAKWIAGCQETPEQFLEIWDGEEHMAPLANNEHLRVAMLLCTAFSSAIRWDLGETAVPGGNVTDRVEDWPSNYRNPDALVVLQGSRAVDRGTNWLGGPDIVVEIISEGEDPLAKLGFYESIGVREFVVLERHPWAVELFQLQSNKLISVCRSDEVNGSTIASGVLPIRYCVVPDSRVRVEVTNTTTGEMWNIAG
jgi:Uma2 family endonuclease